VKNKNPGEFVYVSLGFGTVFTWIFVTKILLLAYTNKVWLPPWISHLFSQWNSWGCTLFFYSWAVFGLDFTSLCNCILQCCIFLLMVIVTCLLVFFTVADICSTLHVYHAYFYLNCIYIILYMSMIEGQLKVSMKQINTCS